MRIFVIILSFCFLFGACRKSELPKFYDIDIDSGWEFKQSNDSSWHTANIPGNLRADLIFNNLLDSSISEEQVNQYRTLIKDTWEYKNIFDIPAEIIAQDSILLKLEGIAGIADVYLNGQYLLKSGNMFRTYVVPVKYRLKEYQNVLLIRFNTKARNNKARSADRQLPLCGGTEINPPFPFLGIWKPIKIIAWSGVIITDCYFETDTITDTQAEINAQIDVTSQEEGDFYISFEINGESTEKFRTTIKKGRQNISIKLLIDNPKLWWCNGMGKPVMYESVVRLWNQSNIISERSFRFGLRKIQLINKADSIGYNFFIRLNEKPVFCKGAVFIPPDLYNFTNNAAKYEQIISDAASANINFLRVWGGGFYESELFYNLCDEYGIMVWQDLPFSLNYLSEKDIIQYSLQEEITENIRRLRNHPSLSVIFGGVNLSSNDEYIKEKLSLNNDDIKEANYLFVGKIPQIINRICKIPVLIDSGYNQKIGEYKPLVRDWRVWYDAAPFSTYFDDPGIFNLEYGLQSFPDNKTLSFNTQDNNWNIIPDEARLYQYCQLPWISKDANGNQLILDYIRMYYNEPVNFEAFVYLSQILQANALKNAIEAHRIRKPFCMGSVFWHFNDCTPAISWSVYDYYSRLKPSYYSVKKAFKNVLVVPERLNGDIRIWAVNDSLASFSGECNISLMDFDGNVKYFKKFSVNLRAEQTQILWLVNESNIIKGSNLNKRMLVVSLKCNNHLIDENILFFSDPLYLDLPVPDITYNIEIDRNRYKLVLTSDRLAKNVVLSCDSVDTRFSDNNIDMLPGRTYQISVDFPGNAEQLKESLKITSLIDSY